MHTILRNTRGSAILIALVVLTVLTMMSTVFFEKLYRFSQASEGVENSNVSYYKALGIIEDGFYTGGVNKYTPWKVSNINNASSTSSGSRLTVSTGSVSVPASGKGNSPYSTDYNIIGLGEPVQLVIPDGITNWASISFQFRVPAIGTSSTGVLGGGSNTGGYILWTLASSGASLFASGETNIFKGSDIDDVVRPINLYQGTTNSGSSVQFDVFYGSTFYLGSNGANCVNFQCTLKLSLIRPVPLSDGRTMTFLEYKISNFPTPIPSQYMDIHAEGYAYGFLRSKDMKFPQITTNTALDFAVLQ